MHFYRNPFGSLLSVRKDEDGKAFTELHLLYEKGKFERDIPFLETLADFGLCPYLDQEGMLCPDIKTDDDAGIINIITPSNAMVLEHGQEQAVNIFLKSMKENDARFAHIEGDDFYDALMENNKAYEEFEQLNGKKKQVKTREKKKEKGKTGEKIIYKLKDKRDIFKYKDMSKNFYIFAGDYYVEAKEGVILDDFLDRAALDVTKGKAFTI